MFVDYLKLSFWLPHGNPSAGGPGWKLAADYWHAARVDGCNSVDSCTRQSFRVEPDGLRIVLDWGGSRCPLDLADFLRRFRRYRGWKVSRLDLAENVPHLSRGDLEVGQAKQLRDFYEVEPSLLDGRPVKVWTGSTIGARGGDAAFFRCYDARKHLDGRDAKVAKFGDCDFWRVEYEFSRRAMREQRVDVFGDLTVEVLSRLWASETNRKGVRFEGTSEYSARPMAEILGDEDELRDARRLQLILAMCAKIAPSRRSCVAEQVRAALGFAPDYEWP